MDMMETIELEDLKAQARQVLEELMEAGPSEAGTDSGGGLFIQRDRQL